MSAIISTWDHSRLTAAINRRLQFPGRSEAQIVNTAAFWIAANTKATTPFVPVPRIDAELAVRVTPRIGKRGQVLSQRSARNRILSGAAGTARISPSIPLAALIIQASATRGSNYNRRTNNRWARTASPFAGVSRARGAQLMRETIHRMISARYSSTHFLQSGWVRAVRALRPFAVNKFRRGSAPPLEDASTDRGGMPRGEGIPAVEGSHTVFAMIENATGMAGTVNAANYNQALITHGAQALENAVRTESRLMEEYAARQMDKDNRHAFAGIATF
jgi:hypothetical protein